MSFKDIYLMVTSIKIQCCRELSNFCLMQMSVHIWEWICIRNSDLIQLPFVYAQANTSAVEWTRLLQHIKAHIAEYFLLLKAYRFGFSTSILPVIICKEVVIYNGDLWYLYDARRRLLLLPPAERYWKMFQESH